MFINYQLTLFWINVYFIEQGRDGNPNISSFSRDYSPGITLSFSTGLVSRFNEYSVLVCYMLFLTPRSNSPNFRILFTQCAKILCIPGNSEGDQSCAAVRCEEAPQGPMGEKGVPGLDGASGEKGDQGLHGDDGEVGEQGPRGEKGSDGPSGNKGQRGEEGDKGGCVGTCQMELGDCYTAGGSEPPLDCKHGYVARGIQENSHFYSLICCTIRSTN